MKKRREVVYQRCRAEEVTCRQEKSPVMVELSHESHLEELEVQGFQLKNSLTGDVVASSIVEGCWGLGFRLRQRQSLSRMEIIRRMRYGGRNHTGSR
ncbi:unnamed protein product [Eruca vesicaria subsp. sativa]|uniref:Uncharacterized protein n=1 Tax=Eruca vesicaria subsp. sativa TaxID=29727 RepID=A0ABC8L522_ERUVS|nr:unnamed protein product [Eruca vesicaria subsp. sativa]